MRRRRRRLLLGTRREAAAEGPGPGVKQVGASMSPSIWPQRSNSNTAMCCGVVLVAVLVVSGGMMLLPLERPGPSASVSSTAVPADVERLQNPSTPDAGQGTPQATRVETAEGASDAAASGPVEVMGDVAPPPQLDRLIEAARTVVPVGDALLLDQVHRAGEVWEVLPRADRLVVADALADALRLRRDGWARSRSLLTAMSPALRDAVIDVLLRDRVRRPLVPAVLLSP